MRPALERLLTTAVDLLREYDESGEIQDTEKLAEFLKQFDDGVVG